MRAGVMKALLRAVDDDADLAPDTFDRITRVHDWRNHVPECHAKNCSCRRFR